MRRLLLALLAALALVSSALALTPEQRKLVVSSHWFAPAWQWNFATGILPPDGSVVVNSPSLGGLVTDSTGALTYARNNLIRSGATMSTQTTDINLGTQNNYLLCFTGAGTVTLSGAKVGGPYSEGATKFTPSSAAALTMTVSGSVKNASLSAVTYETQCRAQDSVYNASDYYGPKFDFGKGLRIWEARTNLELSSSGLSTGYAAQNGTLSTDATLARDGVTTAKKFTATAGTGFHEFYNVTPIAITTSTTYSLSVDALAGGSSCAAVVIQNTTNKYVAAVFSLSGTVDGTAVLTHVGSSATLVSATSTYVGNGRFRLSLVGSVLGTGNVWTILAPSDCVDHFTTTGDYLYTSVGTESAYFSLLQFEQASFPGPYIPTGTSAVAASADALTANAPLSTYLAAGPWTYSWTNGQTGVTSCITGAAGAFAWPQNGWLKSMNVYTARTPSAKVTC